MIRCSVRRAATLAGAVLVTFSVASTAQAATNTQVHLGANLDADGGSGAMTYDAQAAPVGAHLAVDVAGADGGATTVALAAQGLAPAHDFVVRAHVAACGATADAAGAEFRGADLAGPPVADRVAFTLHTDADGDARGETVVPFSFDTRSPGSLVVHEAGTPGAAVACMALSNA